MQFAFQIILGRGSQRQPEWILRVSTGPQTVGTPPLTMKCGRACEFWTYSEIVKNIAS